MFMSAHMRCLMQISHHSLANKQQLTDAAMTSLTQQLCQERQERQAQQSLPQQPAKPDDTKQPWHKRRKTVAAVVWGAASLLQQNNILLRSLKVASLFLLVHD